MVSALDQVWLPPPADLAVTGDEVHVWRAWLDRPACHVKDMQRILSADELDRAACFRFEKDHWRFVVARALLRAILSRYLNVEPDQLRFRTGDHGKPSLTPAFAQAALHFNLSHSDGLALYAVARGREVGIDVERVCPIAEADQIIERLFSASEKAAFRTHPDNSRQELFFTCWARKEAYAKARGEGLFLAPDQFDRSSIPWQPAELLRAHEYSPERHQFSLRNLSMDAEYVAAIAAEGDRWRLACWQYPESG